MSYAQVVLLTRCETTTGYPAFLRDMASYLGFRWHPEYRVVEVPRVFEQTLYRATVFIKANHSSEIRHKVEFVGSTVEVAVHRVAYMCCTILRSEYLCFDDSPFRYVPRGVVGSNGSHFAAPVDLEPVQNEVLRRTAEFAYSGEAVGRVLVRELAIVRDQLDRALSHLAAYTTEFIGDTRYYGFELAPRHLPGVGGYTPARGALLTVDPRHTVPLEYGLQPDGQCFPTGRVALPHDQFQRDRRSTRYRCFCAYPPL